MSEKEELQKMEIFFALLSELDQSYFIKKSFYLNKKLQGFSETCETLMLY